MEISIIIPVYNVERYIERCIQSILNQSFQDFEIITVNDNTPDGSMTIVEKYAREDRRIVMINQPRNTGPMLARETGYRNAKGKFFVFCDSDDLLPEKALETLYDAITTSGASIVIGNARSVSDRKELGLRCNSLSYGTDCQGVYKSLLTGELMHCLWGKIYDRNLFDNKNYDSYEGLTNGEDGVLFYQLISNVTKIKLINNVVYYYYVNTESATRSKITDKTLSKILFSSDYITNFIKKNRSDLSDFLEYREIQRLLSLLIGKVSKKRIKQYSQTMDPDHLCSFNLMLKHFKGVDILINYMLLNNFLARSVYRFFKKIKNAHTY